MLSLLPFLQESGNSNNATAATASSKRGDSVCLYWQLQTEAAYALALPPQPHIHTFSGVCPAFHVATGRKGSAALLLPAASPACTDRQTAAALGGTLPVDDQAPGC
jgi:hypothetical protein